VRVQLRSSAEVDGFGKQLRARAWVAEAWRLAGDCDFEVRLSCRSLTDLEAAVQDLRGVGVVTSTSLVLHRVCLEAC